MCATHLSIRIIPRPSGALTVERGVPAGETRRVILGIGTGSMSGPPECPGPSACPGPACWPFSGLSPTRVCTHRRLQRRMRGSALRTGCAGQRPGFPYPDRGISRCSAGSSGNAALPGTSCRMRIWPRSPLSTASPSSPRIRISPSSPASHGSIPGPGAGREATRVAASRPAPADADRSISVGSARPDGCGRAHSLRSRPRAGPGSGYSAPAWPPRRAAR